MLYQGIYISVVFSQLLLVHSQLVAVDHGMSTTAVDALVSYSATFEKEYLSNTETLFWNLGTKSLARIEVYADTTYAEFNLTSDIRISTSVLPNLPVYNLYLNISDVNLNDSGSVELFRSFPVSAILTFLPLNVKECDNTSDGIDTGINVTKLGSYSHTKEVDVSCSTGYTSNGVQVTLKCLANATWSKTGSCVLETKTTTPTTTTIDTTTSGANSSNAEPGGLLLGAIAAIVIGGILVVLLIIHLSLGVFVGLDVVKTLLSTLIIGGLYVLGSVLSIIGIIMCSSGNLESTADYMNGVEKAGTALGTIGLVIIIAALIKAAVTGGSKDYSAGSQ